MIIHHQDNVAAFAGGHTFYWSLQPLSFRRIGARVAITMVADPGVYTISGTAATTTKDTPLNAEAGAYVISGAPATTVKDIPLEAIPGTYAIVGAPITTLVGRVLVAEPATYEIIGAPVTTIFSGAAVTRFLTDIEGLTSRLTLVAV